MPITVNLLKIGQKRRNYVIINCNTMISFRLITVELFPEPWIFLHYTKLMLCHTHCTSTLCSLFDKTSHWSKRSVSKYRTNKRAPGKYSFSRKRALIIPVNRNHTAKHQRALRKDWRKRGVFRLQANVLLLKENSFYRSLVVDQRNDDLPVFRRILSVSDNVIPVENPGVFHAVALYAQREQLLFGVTVPYQRQVALYLLYGQNRHAGGYSAQNWHTAHLLGPFNMNGAIEAGLAPNVAHILQRFEVQVNGRSGFQAGRLADLPHGGRQAVLRSIF
nr:MAG TPA: hypothetical protein [Caudoviricetes sp.]